MMMDVADLDVVVAVLTLAVAAVSAFLGYRAGRASRRGVELAQVDSAREDRRDVGSSVRVVDAAVMETPDGVLRLVVWLSDLSARERPVKVLDALLEFADGEVVVADTPWAVARTGPEGAAELEAADSTAVPRVAQGALVIPFQLTESVVARLVPLQPLAGGGTIQPVMGSSGRVLPAERPLTLRVQDPQGVHEERLPVPPFALNSRAGS